MSTDATQCRFAGLDPGPYVLGALSPGDRIAFERHLPGCADCTSEVASLAVVPGLLARLDKDTAIAIATNPALPTTVGPEADQQLAGLMGRVVDMRRARRRRNRWRAGLASAVTAVAAAVFTFVLVGLPIGPDKPANQPTVAQPQLRPMRPVGTAPVTAEVALQAAPGGTKIVMHCVYLEDDEGPSAGTSEPKGGEWTMRLIAVGRDGAQEQVSSWTAGPGDALTLTGFTRFTMAQLAHLEVRKGDGTTLLSYTVT
jgi:hypothetical protein